MKIFKFQKLLKDVASRARAKERKKVESKFLDELEDQRKEFLEKIKVQKHSLEKEKEDAVKETENKLGVLITELQEKIIKLEEQVKQDQKAWLLYKNFVPRAMKIANMLTAKTTIKLDNASKRFGQAMRLEEDLEYLQLELSKILPKVEQKMGIQ